MYRVVGRANQDVKAIFRLGSLYQDQGNLKGAEKYHLKALEKGYVSSTVNLANIYSNQGKFKEAEMYYLKAIENKNIDAMYNLAAMYYMRNQNQHKALKLVQNALTSNSNNSSAQFFMNILQLWAGKMEAYNREKEVLFKKLMLEDPDILQLYIMELLVHKQYNYLLNHFEKRKYHLQLKDLFLPYYYTILELIDQNHPHLKRKPPEIEEIVNDIIKEVKRRQKIYYG